MPKFTPAKEFIRHTRLRAVLLTASMIVNLAIAFPSCGNSNETNINAADSSVKAASDTIRATAEPVIRKIDSTIKDNVYTATAKIKSAGKDLREK
jgi:hypothetical protein